MKHGHCTTLLLLTYFLKIYFTKSFILIFKCKMCHKPILTSVWLNDLNISLIISLFSILFHTFLLTFPLITKAPCKTLGLLASGGSNPEN